MNVNKNDYKSKAVTEPSTEVTELAQLFGQKKAALMLGVGQGTVSRIITSGECRPVYNLAAKAVLAQYKKPTSDMLYFVKVSPDKRELFETFVKSFDFKFRTFAE